MGKACGGSTAGVRDRAWGVLHVGWEKRHMGWGLSGEGRVTANTPSRGNKLSIGQQRMSIHLWCDGRRSGRTEKSAVAHERHTAGQAQRRLLKIGRRRTDDRWPNVDDVQRKRPASDADRSVACVHLH